MKSSGPHSQPARASRTAHASKRKSRPFVLMNMSMTADGKIATTNRAVSSFGSRRDQTHMLELRATVDAVMCGARTVDLNDVHLGPGGKRFRRQRLKHGLAEFNLRIIVSGSGSIDPDAAIFGKAPRSPAGRAGAIDRAKSPILILTTSRAGTRRLKQLRALADDVRVCGRTELNIHSALAWLRRKWNVRRLLCEGGGELNDALFRAGVVDELHLTLCPRILGGRRAPTIADGRGFEKLASAAQLQLVSVRRVGDELFLVYRSCNS